MIIPSSRTLVVWALALVSTIRGSTGQETVSLRSRDLKGDALFPEYIQPRLGDGEALLVQEATDDAVLVSWMQVSTEDLEQLHEKLNDFQLWPLNLSPGASWDLLVSKDDVALVQAARLSLGTGTIDPDETERTLRSILG